MRSWINYWMIIPIRFAIKKQVGLYKVYSQVWEINDINLGKYRLRKDK